MLDIEYIRNNPQWMQQVVDDKGEEVSISELLQCDEERREVLQQVQDLRTRRNQISQQMKNLAHLSAEEKQHYIDQGKELKQTLHTQEQTLQDLEERFQSLMAQVPNTYSEDTPIGFSEDDNHVLTQVGDLPRFSFSPKTHWQIGQEKHLIDTETSAEISGSRFAYLKGEVVRMQFGLIQWVFQTLSNPNVLQEIADSRHLSIKVTPFIPVVPPVMMRPEIMDKMGRLHPMEDRYQTKQDGLMLVGSAEHTLGPMHMDTVFQHSDLPLRYVGYSTAFRREAGSYGKDMQGIFRLHQFDKLEIETFVTHDKGREEQEFITAIQEYLLQQLNLPYQVVLKCSGDMGKPNRRAVDMETWMPGQNQYRETHTSDYMADYQARRLNIRYKDLTGDKYYVHMNDATVFALGRILIALIENNQTSDGQIYVPEVLIPFLGKRSF